MRYRPTKSAWFVLGVTACLFLLILTERPGVRDVPPAQPLPQVAAPVATVALPPKVLTPEQLFQQCSPSVVRVVNYDKGGNAVSFGSGFIVAGSLVVTNAHVVDVVVDATGGSLRVLDSAGNELTGAKLVAAFDSNGAHDIAVIQIDPTDKPALDLADWNTVRVGQRVFVIGSPLGLADTLSDGLISAIRSSVQANEPTLQISAPISHGSSGGPVLLETGQVVGVATMFYGGGQNLNFAVPVSDVRDILNAISKDPNTVAALQKDADAGDAFAMYCVGVKYARGSGVPQDYQNAGVWFRKAADAGDLNAMLAVGRMYAGGEGVPQDYQQAMAWYRKAADLGDTSAMSEVAEMYEKGKGMPEDDEQAFNWYRKLADAGDPDFMSKVADWYETGKGVAQDYNQAMAWYGKAADAGNAGAMFSIADIYFEGKGVPQDYQQAMTWYRRAADTGDEAWAAISMHMIGVLYQEGWGVPQDNQQAAIWYRREDAFSESSKNLPAPTVKAPPQPAPPVVQPTTPNVASEAADAEANAQAMTATFLIFLAQPQYGVNPNDAVIAGAWHDWHEHITAYFPGRDRYSITPAEWKEFAADGFVRPAGWLQGLIGSQATTKP